MRFIIKNSKLKIQNSLNKSSIFNLQSLIQNRGFTLLEVLISLAIVSITLVVLIPSQILSVKQGMVSKHYTTAVFLGNEILSDTFMQEDLITGDDGADFEDYPGFSWAREVENMQIAGLREVKIVISGPENIQIILNTYWIKK